MSPTGDQSYVQEQRHKPDGSGNASLHSSDLCARLCYALYVARVVLPCTWCVTVKSAAAAVVYCRIVLGSRLLSGVFCPRWTYGCNG